LHLVVGVTKRHCWHETWHSHELLLLHILSTCITCGSTWHHSWHHWEWHWVGTKLRSWSDWSSGSTVSSGISIRVEHLLLHSHLLSKHGLILLIHLLMECHLLVDHLLLVEHHLLLGSWSSSVFVSSWSHWHHTWHHSWHH